MPSLNSAAIGLSNGLFAKMGKKFLTAFRTGLGYAKSPISNENKLTLAMSRDVKLASSANPIRALPIAEKATKIRHNNWFGQVSMLNGEQIPISNIPALIRSGPKSPIPPARITTSLKDDSRLMTTKISTLSIASRIELGAPKAGLVERVLYSNRMGHYRQ